MVHTRAQARRAATVEQDGLKLADLTNPSYDDVLAAVRQNGMAIQFILHNRKYSVFNCPELYAESLLQTNGQSAKFMGINGAILICSPHTRVMCSIQTLYRELWTYLGQCPRYHAVVLNCLPEIPFYHLHNAAAQESLVCYWANTVGDATTIYEKIARLHRLNEYMLRIHQEAADKSLLTNDQFRGNYLNRLFGNSNKMQKHNPVALVTAKQLWDVLRDNYPHVYDAAWEEQSPYELEWPTQKMVWDCDSRMYIADR